MRAEALYQALTSELEEKAAARAAVLCAAFTSELQQMEEALAQAQQALAQAQQRAERAEACASHFERRLGGVRGRIDKLLAAAPPMGSPPADPPPLELAKAARK